MDHPVSRARIVLADDQPLMRECLREMLEPDHEILGAVEDGQALLEAAARFSPDVVLLDISMPGMSGFKAAEVLRRIMPDVRIILVTHHKEAVYVSEALRIGVAGYVLKPHVEGELHTAIEHVMQGESWVSPSLRTRAR